MATVWIIQTDLNVCTHTQQLANGQLPISAGLQSLLFACGLQRQKAVNWSRTPTVCLTMQYKNHIKKQKTKTGTKHSAKFFTSPDARGEPQMFMFTNATRLLQLLRNFALGKLHWPAKPPHGLWFVLRRGFTAWWGLFRSPEVSLVVTPRLLIALPVFRLFCTFRSEMICPVANHTLMLVLLASRGGKGFICRSEKRGADCHRALKGTGANKACKDDTLSWFGVYTWKSAFFSWNIIKKKHCRLFIWENLYKK